MSWEINLEILTEAQKGGALGEWTGQQTRPSTCNYSNLVKAREKHKRRNTTAEAITGSESSVPCWVGRLAIAIAQVEAGGPRWLIVVVRVSLGPPDNHCQRRGRSIMILC